MRGGDVTWRGVSMGWRKAGGIRACLVQSEGAEGGAVKAWGGRGRSVGRLGCRSGSRYEAHDSQGARPEELVQPVCVLLRLSCVQLFTMLYPAMANTLLPYIFPYIVFHLPRVELLGHSRENLEEFLTREE